MEFWAFFISGIFQQHSGIMTDVVGEDAHHEGANRD